MMKTLNKCLIKERYSHMADTIECFGECEECSCELYKINRKNIIDLLSTVQANLENKKA